MLGVYRPDAPKTMETTVNFKTYFDTEELAEHALEALGILRNMPVYSQAEVQGAYATLREMRLALKGLNRHYGTDGDIPGEWMRLGDDVHHTLVRSDYIGTHWRALAVDLGLIDSTALELLGDNVDWNKVAKTRDAVTVVFPSGAAYWIFTDVPESPED